MRNTITSVKVLRSQAQRHATTVRSLGPWLVLAVPFWLWVGRRAYREEQERQRRLRLAAILKPSKKK